jgi:hypothetical protein
MQQKYKKCFEEKGKKTPTATRLRSRGTKLLFSIQKSKIKKKLEFYMNKTNQKYFIIFYYSCLF